MSMMFGFIGAGNMAYAMMNGIITSPQHRPEQLIAFDPSPERQQICREMGANVAGSIAEVCKKSDVIFLAVKPQTINQVLPEMKGLVSSQIVVSIVAGIGAEYIKRSLGFDAKVAVGMPNTPMLLGAGAMTLAHIPPVTDEEFEMVANLLRSVSVVEKVSARQITQSIPIQGSMPAVIYELGRVIVAYSRQHGFDDEVTLRLYSQTLIGAAKMMTETEFTPAELVKMVCSPGGATLAGMESLQNDGFEASLSRCFDAFIRRADELRHEFES